MKFRVTLEEWLENYKHYDLSETAKDDLRKVFALAVDSVQKEKLE